MTKQKKLTIGPFNFDFKSVSESENNYFWNLVLEKRAEIEQQRSNGENWRWEWVPNEYPIEGIDYEDFCIAVGFWCWIGCWGCGPASYHFYTSADHPVWKSC